MHYSYANDKQNIIKAETFLLNIKTKQARQILLKENSVFAKYLLIKTDFLENILIGGDSSFTQFEQDFDLALDFIENAKTDSLTNIFLSEIYLQKSVVELLNRNFITGAYTFIKAYSFFKKSLEKHPNLKQALKLSALYKIIAGVTPDKGQGFLNLIGLKPDINGGFEDLKKYINYSKNNIFFNIEAKLIYKLSAEYLKDDISNNNKIDLKITINEKNNLSFFSLALLRFKQNNYLETIYYLKKIDKEVSTQIPFLMYMKGMAFTMYSQQNSKKNLIDYIKNTKSKHFIKSAYWQLARISIINNNKKQFLYYKNLTLKEGTAFTEADKSAQYEAQNNKSPNIYLLKSRLLFDSGEYIKALNVLINKEVEKSLVSDNDKAEFWYRLARIYHKTKKTDKALKYYLKTIRYANVKEYFVPYSAFLIAEIYEKNNDFFNAKKYYKLALSLNDNGYKNRLNHKIKSRLKKVNNYENN